MTIAENTLLKSSTFLCRILMASIKQMSYLLQLMCCSIFLQNSPFLSSFITFSGVNSGRDIKFCSSCGMSAGDTFSNDSLMSSQVCAADHSCNVSYICASPSMSGVMKTSFTSIGVQVTGSTGGMGSKGVLNSCWWSLESMS